MSSPRILHDLEIKFGSEYGAEEEAAILEVLRKGAPTSGNECIEFEREFAEYTGARHARAVSNGTAALFLSLVALDLKPGDRVLTTPITWIATAAAAVTLGLEVDFVDVDPETYNLDPKLLKAKLTPNTKAVLPVHLYGQCCDMEALGDLTRNHGFAIVEDACHTVGGEFQGRKAGSFGATGCFSFHEQKNMSTLGEGGMIVTDDDSLFERIALYRSHCTRVYGKSTKYCSLDETRFPMGKRFWRQDFDDCGYNFRMTDIQAAVGRIQLRKLDALNRKRIDHAAFLTQALADVPGIATPRLDPRCKHVFHLYPIRVDPERFGMSKVDFVYAMLHEKGIKLGTHYSPIHLTTAFRKRGFKEGMFPVAERLAERLVTLPINPRQTPEALDYLAKSIRELRA
ncbi:MAG: DegT/DnrJ/EryC1/StrS family aminotransferase [Candidatus Omnitrophica bacterium]|nr:UDP-4-amino-4-deoxy-L-arabinose--oxoglutarate aminotransferase [bacterium]NUN97340.1 DegT/DnrJ/EryC1/StrS family aminotransferase [Candidatus Omnitrophota bacterium]